MSDKENQIKHFMANGLAAQKAVDKILDAPKPDCQKGELVKMKNKWTSLEEHKDSTLDYAICDIYRQADRIEVLEKACDRAIHELGIPGESYPAPVANAYDILEFALGEKK